MKKFTIDLGYGDPIVEYIITECKQFDMTARQRSIRVMWVCCKVRIV